MTDPNPYHGSNFGGAFTGAGNLADGPLHPSNELLVGGFHFDPFTEDSNNRVADVHFVNIQTQTNLMTVPNPDGARGDGFGVGLDPDGRPQRGRLHRLRRIGVPRQRRDRRPGTRVDLQERQHAAADRRRRHRPHRCRRSPTTLAPGRCANRTVGTDAAETLRGTHAGDEIFGFGGNDTIYGYQDRDCLDGGNGDDSLYGGDDTWCSGPAPSTTRTRMPYRPGVARDPSRRAGSAGSDPELQHGAGQRTGGPGTVVEGAPGAAAPVTGGPFSSGRRPRRSGRRSGGNPRLGEVHAVAAHESGVGLHRGLPVDQRDLRGARPRTRGSSR